MRALPRRARGFTLVELLVALPIGLIVIGGAIGLMLATQRHFVATSEERHLQETARVALGHVASNLRMAGFGVDPALAFDFGAMTGARMDRAPGGATFSTTSFTGEGTVGTCTGLCRDSTTGPDELVFLSRDPSFGPHPLTVAPSATDATLSVAGNASVLSGQVLQVVCYTGEMTWAYVRASGASTYDAASGITTIPIAPGTTRFPNQNAWLADPCYGSVATMTGNAVNLASLASAAKVFKVDRYRYFIGSYDASGTRRAWGTPGTRPFLMLDHGLSDGTGALITPIVPDVEDLQLAYVFPYDAAKPVVGATAGTTLSSDDSGINLATGAPAYSDLPEAPTRASHHPGNIRAVRVTVVVRSASADLARRGSSTLPAAGNRAAATGAPGYLRLLVETTVSVPNLSAQSPYYPTYRAIAPTAPFGGRLNVGGG